MATFTTLHKALGAGLVIVIGTFAIGGMPHKDTAVSAKAQIVAAVQEKATSSRARYQAAGTGGMFTAEEAAHIEKEHNRTFGWDN